MPRAGLCFEIFRLVDASALPAKVRVRPVTGLFSVFFIVTLKTVAPSVDQIYGFNLHLRLCCDGACGAEEDISLSEIRKSHGIVIFPDYLGNLHMNLEIDKDHPMVSKE